jgi:hypothetical protein
VDELDSTPAFANLEQWIDLIEFADPADSALRNTVIVFHNKGWFYSIFIGSRASCRLLSFYNLTGLPRRLEILFLLDLGEFWLSWKDHIVV